MKTIRRKIIFLILTLLILTGWLYFGSVIFNSPKPERILLPLPSTAELEVDFTQPLPAPIESTPTRSGLKQTAWIPDWDMTNGLKSLTQAAAHLDSVSPVWYYIEDDGSVHTNLVKLTELKALAKQHSIKVIPSVANFSANAMHAAIGDTQALQNHYNFLVKEIETHGFDGIDLDYESIFLHDKWAYLELIQMLSAYLRPLGKVLSVTVLQQLADPRTLSQTVVVQDWTEIATYADELRIMSYNLTDSISSHPGPISPLDWQEAILRYARRNLDMSKVFLGISLYGYDGWSGNPHIPQPYLAPEVNRPASKVQADAVTYSQVVSARTKYTKLSDVLDPNFLEKVLRYRYQDKEYIIVYQDSSSVSARKQLANKYGAAGVAFWRMGGEDINVYL